MDTHTAESNSDRFVRMMEEKYGISEQDICEILKKTMKGAYRPEVVEFITAMHGGKYSDCAENILADMEKEELLEFKPVPTAIRIHGITDLGRALLIELCKNSDKKEKRVYADFAWGMEVYEMACIPYGLSEDFMARKVSAESQSNPGILHLRSSQAENVMKAAQKIAESSGLEIPETAEPEGVISMPEMTENERICGKLDYLCYTLFRILDKVENMPSKFPAKITWWHRLRAWFRRSFKKSVVKHDDSPRNC